MAVIHCRHFNGYKPCGKSDDCSEACDQISPVQNRILIIHLGALGAVVRATAILKSIHEKYPNSHVTWVTDAPGHHLLKTHPRIDRVLVTQLEDLLILSALEFDIAFVIDKSLKAAGVLRQTRAKKVFGFIADPQTGVIVPATPSADYLWQLGLSNQKKFFENKKSEVALLVEALELGSITPEYDLPMTFAEHTEVLKRRAMWSDSGQNKVIGINTGCSAVIEAKKLPVSTQHQLAKKLLQLGYQVVLLGGPEDSERNLEIGRTLNVIQSSTNQGLRDGYISVAGCDLVITGDSLGMHLAIAAQIPVIAWFGPTCSHEIELYGRGIALEAPVGCAPCWLRKCDKEKKCSDLIQVDQLIESVIECLPREEKNQSGHTDSISR